MMHAASWITAGSHSSIGSGVEDLWVQGGASCMAVAFSDVAEYESNSIRLGKIAIHFHSCFQIRHELPIHGVA